jgi:hypothetical protein
MVAVLVHPAMERQVPPPSVTPRLFELSLSEGAIAVYAYLCSAVRRMQIHGQEYWASTAPVERIADRVFAGSRPNAKRPSLRKRVAKHTQELMAAGLIKIGDRFELEERRGNFYVMTSIEEVRSSTDHRMIMRSNFDDHAIPNGSRIDSERSSMDRVIGQISGERSSTDHQTDDLAIRRSSTDHLSSIRSSINIINNNINYLNPDLDPERERFNSFDPVLKDDPSRIAQKNSDETAIEFVVEIVDEQGNAFEVGEAIEEPLSATAGVAAHFEPSEYVWSRYSAAGDGGSDPGFWDYTFDIVTRWAAGKEGGIGDVRAYALGCIRKQGVQRYAAYLRSLLPVEAVTPSAPSGLIFTPAESRLDFETAIALYREHWKALKLSWDDARLIAWFEAAQRWKPFPVGEIINMQTLPAWVVCRLTEDMGLTVQTRITSGVGL